MTDYQELVNRITTILLHYHEHDSACLENVKFTFEMYSKTHIEPDNSLEKQIAATNELTEAIWALKNVLG